MNNNHVPSVELCKKLKDIGCTRKSRWQEDILYFREDEEDEYRIISKEVYDNVY